ncbi:MAG: Arc family DNA-binding protein [Acidobacteriota bacterium]|nr:Arc family DNA-binding protein [Acidobacteriota bacterium]MDE2924718.1 Arc family DNA-binding protein [Acidobacteriota bacterium]MDE3264368.1 Arc family DNA-binding protein [Acidobacteriota bacterium]
MGAPPRKAFLLRLDFGVFEELQRLAAAELRSVNGQIEYLLREALRQRGRTATPAAVEKDGRDAP